MSDALCTKCGVEPRSGKNRWGTKCIAASRKRPANGAAQTEPNGQTPPANAANVQTPLTRAGERIAELEAEVARLKRELALANAAAFPEPPSKTSNDVAERVRSRGTTAVLTPPKQVGQAGWQTHPQGQCFKTVCWCKAS